MSAIQYRRPQFSMTTIAWSVAILAWFLAVIAVVTGNVRLIDHDAILGNQRIPSVGTILLFLAAWQVMVAGMMLPTAVPMVRAFSQASNGQDRPRLARGAFLGAYFVVWSGFAIVALTCDDGLHTLVDHWSWLGAHEFIISAGLLAFAGIFQFTPLKDQCLTVCRSPFNFLAQHYRRGVRSAWRIGIRHGLSCLGCCWALMLVMFGIGITNLIWWLAALTGVMVLEKTTKWGHKLVPYVGGALIGLGVMALFVPGMV